MSPQPENQSDYRLQGACPKCGTVITLGSDNLRLMMLICEGCGNGLAYHDSKIFSVRARFLEALNIVFKTRYCGQVESFDMRNRYRTAPGVPEVDKIREVLAVEGEDCLDTLKKLSRLHEL